MGANWQCPAHDDRNPSLVVKRSQRKDQVVLHCHAGCTVQAIINALGLAYQDLYPPEHKIQPGTPRPNIEQLEARFQAGALEPERVELGDCRTTRPAICAGSPKTCSSSSASTAP